MLKGKTAALHHDSLAFAMLAGIVAAFPARAQTSAEAPSARSGWTLTPSLQLHGTYTDNVGLAPAGREQGATILDVSPGISLRGGGARVRLSLDYRLQNVSHLEDSTRDRTFHQLSAVGTVEAVEKWFFIDAKASISQQNISVFGTQALDNTNVSGNRQNVSSYSVSPYIKGMLGAELNYELRHNTYITDSGASQLAHTQTDELLGHLKWGTPLRPINWGLDYSQRRTDYANRTPVETDSYRGTVYFHVDPQVSLWGNAGYEKNNYLLGKQSGSTHGFGFQWNPTERTSLVAQRDQRLFGPGYSAAFNHRMPRSAFNVSLSRDVTSTPDALFVNRHATLDNLFAAFGLPPPAPGTVITPQMQAFIDQVMGIQQLSLSTNRIVLQKRLQASYSLLGARNTLTFTASRSESEKVAQGFAITDDFANFSTIRQNGLGVVLSHQLSGFSSLNASYNHTRSAGSGAIPQSAIHDALNLNLNTKLSPKTSATFGFRHAQQSGGVTSYRENSINVGVSFLF